VKKARIRQDGIEPNKSVLVTTRRSHRGLDQQTSATQIKNSLNSATGGLKLADTQRSPASLQQ
jgi:hypothetical protein